MSESSLTPEQRAAVVAAENRRMTEELQRREAERSEDYEAAKNAFERGDLRKANYWLRKARKLNTKSGIKQLLSGTTGGKPLPEDQLERRASRRDR